MSNGPKKVTELTIASSIANNDLMLIVANTSITPVSKSVRANTVANYIFGKVPGPYTNDAAASTAGIGIGFVYYEIGRAHV